MNIANTHFQKHIFSSFPFWLYRSRTSGLLMVLIQMQQSGRAVGTLLKPEYKLWYSAEIRYRKTEFISFDMLFQLELLFDDVHAESKISLVRLESRATLPARLFHFISLLSTSLCCYFLWYLVFDLRRQFPSRLLPSSTWFIALVEVQTKSRTSPSTPPQSWTKEPRVLKNSQHTRSFKGGLTSRQEGKDMKRVETLLLR